MKEEMPSAVTLASHREKSAQSKCNDLETGVVRPQSQHLFSMPEFNPEINGLKFIKVPLDKCREHFFLH